jgi:hypothetical protein
MYPRVLLLLLKQHFTPRPPYPIPQMRTREPRPAPHTRGRVAGIRAVDEQHWDMRHTEAEHPRDIITDGYNQMRGHVPLRGLLSHDNVATLFVAALVLKYSILWPKITYGPSQPPYTQDSVREYIG